MPDEDVTVTLKYASTQSEAGKHTLFLTSIVGGTQGVVTPNTNIPAGASISLPGTPAREGFRFVNWTFDQEVEFADGTTATDLAPKILMPDADLTATSNYESVRHTLTYYIAGADKDPGTVSVQWTAGYKLTAMDRSSEGLQFTGWTLSEGLAPREGFTAESNPIEIVMPDSDAEIKALYEQSGDPVPGPTKYTLTVIRGEEVVNSIEFTEGQKMTLTAAEGLGGRVFKGWTLGEDVKLDESSGPLTGLTIIALMPGHDATVTATYGTADPDPGFHAVHHGRGPEKRRDLPEHHGGKPRSAQAGAGEVIVSALTN